MMYKLSRVIAMCLFTLMNFVGAFKEGAELEGFGAVNPFKDYTFLTVIGIVVCFSYIFISSSHAERKATIARISALTPVYIFGLYMVVSQLFIGSAAGATKVVYLWVFVIPACCLFVGLIRRPKDLLPFLWFIVLFGSFLSAVAFIFKTQNPFYYLSSGGTEGRSWTYIMFGALACSAGLISFIWSTEVVGRITFKCICLCLCLLNFGGVIYSGERGSILFVPVIIMIYLWVSGILRRLVSMKFVWICLIIGVVAIAGGRFIQSEIGETFRQRFEQLGISGGGNDKDVRLDTRGEYVEGSINALKNNPVFGLGPGNYFGFNQGGYPHNLLLEAVGELGLAGLVLYLLVIKMAWRGMRKGIQIMPPHIGYAYLSITLLYFFRTFKSGNLSGSRYYWLLIASWMVVEKFRLTKIRPTCV